VAEQTLLKLVDPLKQLARQHRAGGVEAEVMLQPRGAR
jgi:hypothetical protein